MPCGEQVPETCESDCVDSFENARLVYCPREVPTLVDCIVQNPTDPMYACNNALWEYLGPCQTELAALKQCVSG